MVGAATPSCSGWLEAGQIGTGPKASVHMYWYVGARLASPKALSQELTKRVSVILYRAGASSSKTGSFVCQVGVQCVAVHNVNTPPSSRSPQGWTACGIQSDTAITITTNGNGKSAGQPQKRCSKCKRQFSLCYWTTPDGASLLELWNANQLSQ